MAIYQRITWLLAAILLSALPHQRVSAQAYPPCPPPGASEFLLLVRGDESARQRSADLLPADHPVIACDYLGEVVLRAGGFDNQEAVNSWAIYLTDIEALSAFVIEPSGSASTATTATALPYQPQRLPQGYAVLVDYQNQPALAAVIEQRLGSPLGLAVYQDRPYLLATFSADAAMAAATLQQLTANNWATILVEGQQVVRLTPRVSP